jgi:hypothetical protein
MTLREPTLTLVAIADLRPTQITVGLREVAEKRQSWRAQSDAKGGAFLGTHMIPVIRGPKGRLYVIDHHHLARALHDEGQDKILTNPIADLSQLTKDSFWVVMDCKGWCHPYDATGKRRDFADIPTAVADLVDDPFRSLAGGHDPVQRIHLGGFPAQPHQTHRRRRRFRQGAETGVGAGEGRGSGLSARLVRAGYLEFPRLRLPKSSLRAKRSNPKASARHFKNSQVIPVYSQVPAYYLF